MRIVKTAAVYILLFGIGLLSAEFVAGSFAGSHSLKYDREGTWLCWMPTSRMYRDCGLLTKFVPVSELDDVAPSARGYIRCREGRVEIGNIDIDTIKGGRPLIDPTALECEP